jgi:hypothetical protein
MSTHSPVQQCGNLFAVTSDIGSGICALADALKAINVDRIDDQEVFLSGIGHLLNTLGVELLDTSQQGRYIADAPAP